MNNRIHVSPSILVYSGHMPRSGIAESYGGFIPSVLRNLHTIFHSVCINLHSHQQCKSIPFSPYPLHKFWPVWGDWHLIVVLICISLTMRDVEHLLLCLLAICLSSLEKCPLGLFHTFWLVCLFSWHWVLWNACIFWILILCQLFHLLLFSPILRFVFHFPYSFICCAKAFKVNSSHLSTFVFISITLGVLHRGSCFDLHH